jgi:hypothetical protein
MAIPYMGLLLGLKNTRNCTSVARHVHKGLLYTYMYICMYIFMSLSLSLSLCVRACVCVYTYLPTYIHSLSLSLSRTHTGAIPKVPVSISSPRNDAVTAPGLAMGSSISIVLYPTAPHEALLCTYIDPTEPEECKRVKRDLRCSQKRPALSRAGDADCQRFCWPRPSIR